MQKRLISAALLLAYCFVLIRVMIFKVVPVIKSGQVTLDFGGVNGGHAANFVPFATIAPYLLGHNGLTIAFLNLAGNIALLVPLGFLVPLVFPNTTWKKSLALGAVAGLAIETMQTLLNVGIFDIDDVLLNALGVLLGYVAFVLLAKWLRERNYKNIVIAAMLVIAAAAGAFYIMYPHGEQPVNPAMAARDQWGNINNGQEGTVPQTGDLCGGTGGTGEIVGKGSGTIAIKSKEGVVQTITLTNKTEIRNSAGPISASDLKIGEHVTVVVLDEAKTATTVLVCNASL